MYQYLQVKSKIFLFFKLGYNVTRQYSSGISEKVRFSYFLEIITLNLKMEKNVSYEIETELTTLSSRGQVVIPKGFRRRMKLSAGDFLGMALIGDMLVIKRIDMPTEDIAKSARAAEKNVDAAFEELLYRKE